MSATKRRPVSVEEADPVGIVDIVQRAQARGIPITRAAIEKRRQRDRFPEPRWPQRGGVDLWHWPEIVPDLAPGSPGRPPKTTEDRA